MQLSTSCYVINFILVWVLYFKQDSCGWDNTSVVGTHSIQHHKVMHLKHEQIGLLQRSYSEKMSRLPYITYRLSQLGRSWSTLELRSFGWIFSSSHLSLIYVMILSLKCYCDKGGQLSRWKGFQVGEIDWKVCPLWPNPQVRVWQKYLYFIILFNSNKHVLI